MYILVLVDNINIADGPNFVSDGTEIICASTSVAKLKNEVDKDENSGSSIKWKIIDDRWFGHLRYDDEESVEEQYYVIIKTKVII